MVKSRGGRPLQGDTPKRAAISIKVRQDLRDFLQAAATDRGRSFTQEVEHRLEDSRLATRLASDHPGASIVPLIMVALERIEKADGQSWLESPATFIKAQAAVTYLMRKVSGPNVLPEVAASADVTRSTEERERSVMISSQQTMDLYTAGVAIAEQIAAEMGQRIGVAERPSAPGTEAE